MSARTGATPAPLAAIQQQIGRRLSPKPRRAAVWGAKARTLPGYGRVRAHDSRALMWGASQK